MDKTGEEANGLMIKIDELNLFNEKSDQELKKAKAIKQVQYFVFFLIQGTIFPLNTHKFTCSLKVVCLLVLHYIYNKPLIYCLMPSIPNFYLKSFSSLLSYLKMILSYFETFLAFDRR